MVKNSFSLIETLLSLIIIFIMIGGFTNLLVTNPNNLVYQELQQSHNEFIQFNKINSKFEHIDFK